MPKNAAKKITLRVALPDGVSETKARKAVRSVFGMSLEESVGDLIAGTLRPRGKKIPA